MVVAPHSITRWHTRVMERLRKLDVYPKINEDFFTRTTAGGFITLGSSILMLLLFIAEARLFLSPHIENVLMVDTSRGAKLQVRSCPCARGRSCSTPRAPPHRLSLPTRAM